MNARFAIVATLGGFQTFQSDSSAIQTTTLEHPVGSGPGWPPADQLTVDMDMLLCNFSHQYDLETSCALALEEYSRLVGLGQGHSSYFTETRANPGPSQ